MRTAIRLPPQAQPAMRAPPGLRKAPPRAGSAAPRPTASLLVLWRSVEDHEVGFRPSRRNLEWKRPLHHFYGPFPVIEHFVLVDPQRAGDAL